jgi:hypothetical protein
LESEVLEWVIKIYSPEKGKTDMYIKEALISTHWEAFGISRGRIGAVLREKNLSFLMDNLSLRFPKNFWLRPLGRDLNTATRTWRLSNLNELVTP